MPGSADWRSPVMVRSDPAAFPINNGITFDSAAKVAGTGFAPELMYNAHNTSELPGAEFTVIPNDGISFPETGRQIISFMSVNNWKNGTWRTNYAGLAFSDNGNDFIRADDLKWMNNSTGTSPHQMWSMQRDGNYVYIFSVANGRDLSLGIHLRRVHWERMFWPREYQSWNGSTWVTGMGTKPLINGRFSEPSVKKLGSVWAMSYIDPVNHQLVTRKATKPTGPWSEPKVQISSTNIQGIYGGFIHPYSTPDNLHMLISQWNDSEYCVKQYVGKL